MPNRDRSALYPPFAAQLADLESRLLKELLPFVLFMGLRTWAEQDALYAQGRTAPGRKVTNAGPGESIHNYHCAWDFVPLVNGKAVWDDDDLWQRCGAIAREVGAEWGGDWQRFKDKPHCQFTNGLTLDQLKAGAHP